MGLDLGGSIREPAHFNGIHGFKPTSLRLTNLDARPDILGIGQEAIMPQAGPMARSVSDLTLAMSVLAAPGLELIDPAIPPVPWRNPASVDIKTLRVAMYTDDGYFSASPALRRAVREAADALRQRGAHVEEWQPPDVAQAVRLFLAIASAGGATPFKRALGGDKPVPQIKGLLQAAGLPTYLRRSWMRAASMPLSAHQPQRQPFCMEARPTWLTSTVMRGSTVFWGMPAGVVAATRVRADEESDRTPGKNTVERTARAVEAGSAGLPVGVQVVARHWREDAALAVMAALEEHFRMQPDYPARPPI